MSDAPERIWAVAESDFSAQTIDIIAAASPDGFVDKPSEYLRADIAARAHEEGQRAGYRHGLEEAAAWHDAEARQFEWQWVEILKLPLPNPVADKHREYAAALRAMMEGKE
jgi:hypothetical protein